MGNSKAVPTKKGWMLPRGKDINTLRRHTKINQTSLHHHRMSFSSKREALTNFKKMGFKNKIKSHGLDYNFVVEYLPNMCKTLN